MIVRDETPADAAAVRRVVGAAFGQEEEADLVDALRASGDAVIALVAEDDGEVVGHIMFSKLQAPKRCVALAPVAVTPARQRQGIGSRLVRAGLARARRDGWRAAFVVGEPDYYGRFGFSAAAADGFETPYPKPYFMALALAPHALDALAGPVVFAPPFRALE